MFFRRCHRRKNGKQHTYWTLVESYRTARGSRQRGGSYSVGTPEAKLRQFEQHLTEMDWHEVQAGVEVKLVAGPEGEDVFIWRAAPIAVRKSRRCISVSSNAWRLT